MADSLTCAQHHLLGVPLKANSWCFCIAPRLESTVDAMIIGIHYLPWCQGAKEKKSYFENVHYYTNLEYDMH